MYQGKFDKKHRNSAPPAPVPAAKSRGPRLGGMIFYTVFFAYTFLFYTATYLGLSQLRDWLGNYEKAQPTYQSLAVFEQLFSDPDWSELYDAAGIQDTVYERRETFVAYMEELIGSHELTYMETSTGLSEDKKYIVRLGDTKIAAFTLVDHNEAQSASEIPDWQLGGVDLFFTRSQQYFIQKTDGHTAYVNGIPLEDSHTIRIRTTKAEEYLPDKTGNMQSCTQQIAGLLAKPTVTITDETGAEMAVQYDEATHTFTEQTQADTLSGEEKTLALNAVKTYAKYMIKRATDADLSKYFKKATTTYETIVASDLDWVKSAASNEFVDESVTSLCRYSEDLYSVRVSVNLLQTRSDGSVKENPIRQSLIFQRQSSGTWLCIEMTAADVSEPVEKVRLTFLDGDTVLSSDFYAADITRIICPAVSPPEGKVFSGWAAQETDENGNSVLRLVFQPDEENAVFLPAGTVLEPMTLQPLFEDA